MLVFLLPTRETKKFMVILFCLENFLQFFREERQSWSRHHLPNLIASLAFFVALQKTIFHTESVRDFFKGPPLHIHYLLYSLSRVRQRRRRRRWRRRWCAASASEEEEASSSVRWFVHSFLSHKSTSRPQSSLLGPQKSGKNPHAKKGGSGKVWEDSSSSIRSRLQQTCKCKGES